MPADQSRLRRLGARPGRVVAVVVIVCALVALAVWRLNDNGPAPLTKSDVDRAVQQSIAQEKQRQRNVPPDAAVAYRTILPSLVTVTSEPATTGTGAAGSGTVGKAPAEGELGAGVVINADGSVLTALHVVARGGLIHVRFADGTLASAQILAKQDADDIAVLAVDRLPQIVVPAVMGGGVQVGDAVFPVGNPLGLAASLSAGVVSALDRSVHTDDGRTLGGLIQFDAAVNPGNSGGPLLNRAGQVIGIVTGLANPSQQPYFVGIGFAVPIAVAGGTAGAPPQ
jgi:S1-C subfamily serine protease